MKKTTIAIILMTLLFQNCDFEQYQDDPNRTTEASPGLILTNLIPNSFNIVDVDPLLMSRMMVYTDAQDESQYYNWNRSGYGTYDNLRQAEQMILEAENASLPNYTALAKFFKAYHFYSLTMVFGDVPMSEALKGIDGDFQPVYDPQEDVFDAILSLLEDANEELRTADSSEPELQGDVLFNGNLMLWRKSINSFRLRVLMTLSNKDLAKYKDQFSDIVGNPTKYPIINSSEENLELDYFDVSGSRYAYFDNSNIKIAYVLENSFVELLKLYQDPRLFQLAQVTPASGGTVGDFDAYGGLEGHVSFTDMQQQFVDGIGSFAHTRYTDDPTVEPSIVMSYAEVQFIIAEAAQLGWITADPEVHYNGGITANMEFYGVSPTDISTYLAGPLVAYNPTSGIEMINTQKYLTFFFTSGYTSFYNQRRTGFPTFLATEFNNGQIPVRWLYPEEESRLNASNLEASLQSQFGGTDDINAQMWLLK